MELSELYQELIIDHGTKPRNFYELTNANYTAEGLNPFCGDKIQLYLLIENNIITKASFTGTGCAISTASASIMTEILIGKTKEEALKIFIDFTNLVVDGKEPQENIGKLLSLSSVKRFPNRVKCATLAWHTLESAIQKTPHLT